MHSNRLAWMAYFPTILLTLTAPVYAASASIELCKEPLTLHMRRPASDYETAALESFDLCGATAQTDISPPPNLDAEQQQELIASGLALSLNRTASGMRVQLKLGGYQAEPLELRSNAPEQVVHWRKSKNITPPPALLMRVERSPIGSGLNSRYKVAQTNQPSDAIVRKLIAAGQLDVYGLDLLCKDTMTLNFEAIAAGHILGLVADVCDLPMQTPSDGSFLRFMRTKDYRTLAKQPVFKDREAELKHSITLANVDGRSRITATDALFELADLALSRHEFASARAYLAQIRTLPQSWFGATNTSIDIALARVEVQAGRHKSAEQLLITTLRELDQSDPDQISDERADALLAYAELHAAKGEHAQARKIARIAYAVNEQLINSDGYRKRQDLLIAIVEAASNAAH